ncbi:MAG: tetratricopeptide repeat protein [Janthinobacterium lividum]
MTHYLSRLSLSVAYVALTISIQTFMPSTLEASDRNEACTENEENYFVKKYPFSTSVLDANKLTYALLTSKDESEKSRLFSVLEAESTKKGKDLQEKLYAFYTRPLAGGKFNNKEKANQVLRHALDQKQAWAYWEQAEKIKKSPNEVVKEHFLAANLSYLKAEDYIKKNYQDNWVSTFLELMTIPTKQQQKSKSFIPRKINEIEAFRDKYIKQKYALPLVHLYQTLVTTPHLSLYKDLYWSIVKTAADLDCLEAQTLYAFDQYQKNNLVSALKYFEKAANRGHPHSMHYAAVLLDKGIDGQLPNRERALELYLSAADFGNFNAMNNAAVILEQNLGIKNLDMKRVFQLYEQAAALEHPNAIFNMGRLLEEGFEGQFPSKKRAFQYYKKAAALGNPDAMNSIAVLLIQGFEGQLPDKKQALKYFEKATALGHAGAMYNTALLLSENSDKKNLDKKPILQLYLQAAALGHPHAMNNLGALLKKGFKRQLPDKKRAFAYFEQAAALGGSAAIFNMALSLYEGFEGQDPDKKQALELFKELAHSGDVPAMHSTAIILTRVMLKVVEKVYRV